MRNIHVQPAVSDDEAAAALAAVRCLLADDQPDAPPQPSRSAWSSAAALATHDAPPARNGAYACWSAIERAGRARRWSLGIVGL